MGDVPSAKIEHTALSEKVYLVLRTSILKRELGAGQKILADETASQLCVSRTPVKDALNRLALEGLVEIVPRRGTFVSRLTSQQVADLQDVRLLLELGAAQKAMENGATGPLLAELEKCIAALDRVAGDEHLDPEAWMSWNRELHLSLIRSAHNSELLRAYARLNIDLRLAQVLLYSRGVEYLVQTQQEHRAICDALRNFNGQQVKEALSRHVNTTKAEALKGLSG